MWHTDSSKNHNKYTSCPDWRISPHADRHHRKRLQHWPSPSKRRHVSHTVRDVRASLSHRANTVERVIDFSIFDLGGLPLGQSSPKGEKTWGTPRSTILQNFIALCHATPEISITKIPADRKTEKQTVTDISSTCLSACVDNKQTDKYASCPDWRNPHMPTAVTANSLQHWPSPSKRRPVSRTVRDGRASLLHRANERWTCYQFFNFWPWGLPLGG